MKSLMLCCSTTKRPPGSGDQNLPCLPIITDSESSFPSPSSPAGNKSINSEPEPEPESEPDLSAIYASKRFFFSSPGSSNSIFGSSPSTSAAPSASSPSTSSPPSNIKKCYRSSSPAAAAKATWHDDQKLEVDDKYSSDPYSDFKRSMEEMVEAHGLQDVRASWDFLHELLLCYLVLNHKSVHRFITGAFTELVMGLMFP